MAKRSKIVANRRRAEMVKREAGKRAALKAIIADPKVEADERFRAVRRLSAMPRDGSAVRLRNRDAVDGRPRGYLRIAGLSRVRFRAMAHRGELPGIVKSSW